jgi:hypothetical protein
LALGEAAVMAYGTARKHDVNFGDRSLLRGNARVPLADISVPQSQGFTLYASVTRIEPAGAAVVPWVTVEWGHGGASLRARDYQVCRRLRVPVAGSTVKVSGRLLTTGGGPPPASVVCQLALFVAPGSDGQTLRNTTWLAQQGAQGLASAAPEQLMTIEGYSATPGGRWLMVFDATALPGNGTFPALAVPAQRRFRRRRFDSQMFARGIYWAASSSPITLTFDPTALLRVDVEVLT